MSPPTPPPAHPETEPTDSVDDECYPEPTHPDNLRIMRRSDKFYPIEVHWMKIEMDSPDVKKILLELDHNDRSRSELPKDRGQGGIYQRAANVMFARYPTPWRTKPFPEQPLAAFEKKKKNARGGAKENMAPIPAEEQDAVADRMRTRPKVSGDASVKTVLTRQLYPRQLPDIMLSLVYHNRMLSVLSWTVLDTVNYLLLTRIYCLMILLWIRR